MADAARATGGAELVLVNWREGHWLFARQPIVHFGFSGKAVADSAVYWLRQHPRAFALIPAAELGRCFSADKARKLGDTSRHEWYVVGADADNGQCQAAPPAQVYHFTWADTPGNLQAAKEGSRQ